MPSGFNLHLKVAGLAGILKRRETIDEPMFDAICCYSAAAGNYERVERTYETSRGFDRATKGQTKLIHQFGYFDRIDDIVQTQILPLAKKVSWYDLKKADRKSERILAKRKERAERKRREQEENFS